MGDWQQEQDEALAELLDPPALSRPLFPKFPGKQAVPYADLEPKEFLGLQGLWDRDDFTLRLPSGSWIWDNRITGPSPDLLVVDDLRQPNVQAQFDRLVAEAKDLMAADLIRADDLQIFGEPRQATVKITDITET